jgi:hypothetical protein
LQPQYEPVVQQTLQPQPQYELVAQQTLQEPSAIPASYAPAVMYEAGAPVPATYQTMASPVNPAYVPAVNAAAIHGAGLTTNASYLPAPAPTAAGAYGASAVPNAIYGSATPPSMYAPAPTYGTGVATIGGAPEAAMAATGGWSYAPPAPGAYGAGAVASTNYGTISAAATATPAAYAPPMGAGEPMAGGWSYAPPFVGAAGYPVA